MRLDVRRLLAVISEQLFGTGEAALTAGRFRWKGALEAISTPQRYRGKRLQRHHVDAGQLRRGSDLVQLEKMLRAWSHALRPALEPDGVVAIVLLHETGRQRHLAVKRTQTFSPTSSFSTVRYL